MTQTNRDNKKFLGTTSFGNERGALLNIKSVSATSAALSGATATFSSLIPAGAVVLGVTVRVTTLITGATSFNIGDGTDADKWGATIALTAGTVTTGANFTAGTPAIYTSATNVVLTAVGSNFTAGVVVATVHYYDFTGATA